MPKFIKLTGKRTGVVYAINSMFIEAIIPPCEGIDATRVSINGMDTVNSYRVKESMDEILAMIAE